MGNEIYDENKLMILENNELELTKEGIQFIKKLQKAKVEVTKMEEQLKEIFLNKMEENNIDKFISADGTFKATYVKETTSKTFDSKKFKEENPDVYENYLKETTRKAYIKFS